RRRGLRVFRRSRARRHRRRAVADPRSPGGRGSDGRAGAGLGASDVRLGFDRTLHARCVRGRACSIAAPGRMTTALRSILMTPNLLGKDGVSTLSREVIGALPAPSLALSLHDSADAEGEWSRDVELHGARGSRLRFLVDVVRAMPRVTPDTLIVCSHLHL